MNLEEAGRIAVDEATRLWNSDVWDPPKHFHSKEAEVWRSIITDMIVSDNGLGWYWKRDEWNGDYPGDGFFEWCGAFVARCYSVAGLKLSERRKYFASTYRLQAWASYHRIDEKTLNPRPKTGPERIILELDADTKEISFPDGTLPRAGDILIVGGVNTGSGKHITLVQKFDARRGEFHTIEGNAHGIGPDGKQRQGIIKTKRPLGLPNGLPKTTYHARWLIRPALSDFDIK